MHARPNTRRQPIHRCGPWGHDENSKGHTTPHPSAVMQSENLTTTLQPTEQPGKITLLQTAS